MPMSQGRTSGRSSTLLQIGAWAHGSADSANGLTTSSGPSLVDKDDKNTAESCIGNYAPGKSRLASRAQSEGALLVEGEKELSVQQTWLLTHHEGPWTVYMIDEDRANKQAEPRDTSGVGKI
ncbi:hypothetical protein B0T14DRAFT_570736 [Immersiella caudata]|uniref:Uncharacterized protein n=1 Tax=Immersiella caudata TaxID=314043 RepID=A0AA39TMT2_9PEZI|nr:hypothetical protein B0T14DRAFT_570736 [Immersiella caudata]